MAITVWQGVARALRAEGTVMIQVSSPEDPALLEAALSAAAADIADIGYWVTEPDPADPETGDWEGAEVTGPIPVPGSCLLVIHAGNTPPQMQLGTIPALLTHRLEEAGITEAAVGRARVLGERYQVLESFTPVARALVRGPRDRRDAEQRPYLIAELIDIAREWLGLVRGPKMELNALVISAEIPISSQTLPPLVGGILEHGSAPVTVIASDFRTQVATAVFGEFSGLGLKLTSGGLDRPAAEVARHMRLQRDILSAHAGNLYWAGVTAQDSDGYLLFPRWFEWDNVSFLPAWYQILAGEGHQLAGVATYPGGLRPGFTEVSGAIALTVGQPEQWVPGHPDRETVRAQARRELTAGAEY